MTEIICTRCGQAGHRASHCPWPTETLARFASSERKPGVRQDGIHTMADLIGRCRRDSLTGCLVLDAPRRKGSSYVWFPPLNNAASLPTVLAHLIGKPLERSQMWVPTCGNTACCELQHRVIGTRSDLMRIMRPALDPLHRARIAVGKRAGGRYSAELRAEIMHSAETGAEIANRIGMHQSHVCRIRRGEAWRDTAPTASVFSLGAAR